jgi:streptogrisin C
VVGGFVTAGHCGTPGAATAGYNGAAQGTFQASSFPGDDMAWVATNASGTPQPWVNQYNGYAAVVGGSTAAPPGSAICRSGSTTGWHCGTVQATGSTVNYPQGTVFGLTMTNACAEPGDSGGSWLSGNQAQGVTSGGSGTCTSGGTTYFQPVNEILSAYGLTLVTG